MVEPGIWADALNKFSQLTPWVQVAALAFVSVTVLGMCYFLKEIVLALAHRRRGDGAERQ